MFRNPSNWKYMLTSLVGCFIVYTVILDFTNPVHPDWNLFRRDELPSDTEVHGIKAAMLAMAGAATLFIGFIPVGNNHRSRRGDLSLQIVGALAVGLTGWFWLLSATNGEPGPYLAAIVPSMGVFAVVFISSVIFKLVYDRDETQLKETGSTKLTWKTVILGLILLFAFALIIGAIVFIPKWLF